MSVSLVDPYLKTARAHKHLKSLEEAIADFAKNKSHRVRRERDPKNQRYRIQLVIRDVPEEIPLIAGDFIGCLRSSLDHLVWCLAKLRKPYPLGTSFPILKERNGETLRKCTGGVPPEARKIIESLQPYHRPQATVTSHMLWQLNQLWNIDKHRRIPVGGDVSTAMFPDFPRNLAHLVEFDHANGTISVPLHLENKMRLQPDATFNVVFGDAFENVFCDVAGLNHMYEFVANGVTPKFSRFFK